MIRRAGCLALLIALLGNSSSGLANPAPEEHDDAELMRHIAIKPFWAKRLTGYLRTRDGEELHYSVLLPRGKGPFPTLLHYSGYDAGSIGGTAYLAGRTTYPRTIERRFLSAGYAVIGVNTRSTGCSTGSSFDWQRPLYGQDGYDAVEFAAAQPWSTGQVGMYSWSWAGMSQLWTASMRPPHLKAIAPGNVIADPRADSYAPGGVPQPTMITQWGEGYVPQRWQWVKESAQAEGDTRCLAQVPRNLETLEAGSPGHLVLQHPLKDAYLEERAVARRTHLIEVPVLSLTSFQDEATSSRGGYYQWTLEPQLLWMVDTNGSHDIYASEVFQASVLSFFDHFLKGEKNRFEATPRLQIWEQSRVDAARAHPGIDDPLEQFAPGWIVTRPTPSPDLKPRSFALSAGARLDEAGASSGPPDSLSYPVPGPAVLATGSTWGAMNPHWKEGSAVYTSAALPEDFVTYGPAGVELWVSSENSPDADLAVTITVVHADGQEQYVQRGWLRLSNRALDERRSKPGSPVLLDTADSLAPLPLGRPVLAHVEINRFSNAFRKGDRIRLWIEAPGDTGTYTFSYNPVPTTLKIWHDPEHGSKLVLNELAGERVPSAFAASACPQALSQPCRPDPLAAGR